MEYLIKDLQRSDYGILMEIWESSVRATHTFITEGDIAYFKPLILDEYLDAVMLRGILDHDNKILGFLGVADQNIEMLFIHPDYFGMGLGTRLVVYAREKFQANRVDVNEQNVGAVNFYKHMGFKIKSRSDLDPTGRPYPILHMHL